MLASSGSGLAATPTMLLTPLLLVRDDLNADQAELKQDVGHVCSRKIGLELGREQNDVDRGCDQEEQHALDEGDEGPVEDMECPRRDLLSDDLPGSINI